MTTLEEFSALNRKITELNAWRKRVRKTPEQYTEDDQDDARLVGGSLKAMRRELRGMSKVLTDKVNIETILKRYEGATLLRTLESLAGLRKESWSFVQALYELEAEGKIIIIREPSTGIPYREFYREEGEPAAEFRQPIPGHGFANGVCGDCQIKLK